MPEIGHMRQMTAFDADADLEAVAASLHDHWVMMPVLVTKKGDGSTTELQPAVKVKITLPDATTKMVTLPQLKDVPIHYPGGGKVTTTHPVEVKDPGIAVFSSLDYDPHFEKDGIQEPTDPSRVSHLSHGRFIPGGRPVPRKIPHVDPEEHHVRTLDATHTHAVGLAGIKTKVTGDTVDDPYNKAKTFFQTLHHKLDGIIRKAVKPGVEHSDSIDHTGIVHAIQNALHTLKLNAGGIFHAVQNSLHTTKMTPSDGIIHSAFNGASIVSIKQLLSLFSSGAVNISSATSVGISAPSLSLPAGGVASAALAAGAAATNVGTVGGDLDGTLPNPNVVGCHHIANADTLGLYANDTDAAAGGVVKGGLYLWSGNTPNLLAVRTV
jgi:hypothetical protein